MIRRNPRLDQNLPMMRIKVFALITNYFLGYLFIYPLIGVYITYLLTGVSDAMTSQVAFGIYVFLILLTLFLAWPIIMESLRMSKGRWVSHLKKIPLNYIFLFASLIVVNTAISTWTGVETSANQELVFQSFMESPGLIIFAALIMAPIVEELVFRGALYRALRNRTSYKRAIFISMFAFGFIHVFASLLSGDYMDLWNIFTYMAMGLFFVKIYEETGSVFPAIFLHFLNNAIALGIMWLSSTL
jgi:membrane protease YdiL (CAAX protease family)